MPTIKTTLKELEEGLKLASGAFHTVVLPSTIRVRLVGLLFETDKTFLLPSALVGIRNLRAIYGEHTGKTVLVSGHADRAGSAQHNLALSVERAEAVAAFLKDDAGDWLPRYRSGQQKSLAWGVREDQYMLSEVVNAGGEPYFDGSPSGQSDAATVEAVHAFQTDNGLPKGAMDEKTRKLLIQKYMATDGTTLPEGTNVVIHGCGENHPTVATADSVALEDNRRVELFFFPGPVEPSPVEPCPTGGCASYPIWVERSSRTVDISVDPEGVIFLVDELGMPLRQAPIQVVLPGGGTLDLTTDNHGRARPMLAPGTTFDVVVFDAHEGGAQDSLVTPSGRHFAAGGDGPAKDGGKP